MDTKEKRQFVKRKESSKGNKSVFPIHYFLRLAIFVIVFGLVLIVLLKQNQCIVIQKYEINLYFWQYKEGLENTSDESIDSFTTSTKEENSENEQTILETLSCTQIPVEVRFDCHPEDGASELSCTNRGCCWNPPNGETIAAKHVPLNVPYCYYTNNWTLYKYENFSRNGNDFTGFLKKIKSSFYEHDLPLVKMETRSIDDSILRVKIYDPLKKRYEPPWPKRTDSKTFSADVDAKYKLNFDDTLPGFKVYRTSDYTKIFDSINIGSFIFSDQFLQMSSLLPSDNIYGLGEHRTSLKLSTHWQSFTMFNKDQPPTENANLYGSHPFYLIMEDGGNAHGVLFLNSNAMDVILQPAPAITFRTIGGIFDMYFFLGPTPMDVIKQYSTIVGKPFLPPYWSLGFHLCRYGYGSLEATKKVWNRTIEAGIPFDTQWNDLDYMDKNNDFTYNSNKFKDLPEFINEIHSMGMHYVPLIDAGVSGSENKGTYPPLDEGVKEGIFVKDGETDQPFVGKVWNLVSTVWPDFTNPKTNDYYLRMMSDLHTNIAYDGAWIDMNEPSNFYDGRTSGCSENKLDYPKYVPNVVGGKLATKTLCMNAKHYLGSHYDLHNTYGTSQAVATNYALTKIRKKRPFIISRSTWVGHGRYAGHWTGDVYSSWHDLRRSIPAILTMNFYQIPMIGADICGFDGNTTELLCNRWMQLGAFYPFSRNHNSDSTIEQDPVSMGELVVRSSKRALKIRYTFLPYLYTLFFRAHRFGETVVRPLFFEFPTDQDTYGIDTQFLWGKSMMIIPVLEENAVKVTAYLPRGIWYNFYTKESLFSTGKNYTLDAPLDTIPIMFRGGSILPGQKPNTTTTSSRKNDFDLVITLDEEKMANGELYWDDGDSLDSFEKGQFVWSTFLLQNNTLSSSEAKKSSFDEKIILDSINVWGITSNVSRVVLNNREIKFVYEKNCLSVCDLQIDLRKNFKLFWEYIDSEIG